jgi:ATP-binding protein involved in chromosome partitioning
VTTYTPKTITRSDPTRLEIEWSDGQRTVFRAAELRRICPCAMCVNELTGARVLDPGSIADDLTQSDAALVGHYALTLRFSDGHHTGIFTFRYLRDHDPRTVAGA